MNDFPRSEADTNKNVNNLSDYMESLSDISRELNVLTEEHLLPLKQMCILTVGHYPQVSSNFQYTVVNAVMITMFNISLAPGNHIVRFLEDIGKYLIVSTVYSKACLYQSCKGLESFYVG